jgi:hypothetical protein
MSSAFDSQLGRVADHRFDRNLAVFAAMLFFAMFHFTVSWTANQLAFSLFHKWLLDSVLTGFIFAMMAGVILRAWCRRRRFVRNELRRVADLNHNVRNALEIIGGARYLHANEQAEVIGASVARIDETLQRLFPVVDERSRSGFVRLERRKSR